MRILICDDDTLILEHIYKLLKYYFESAHLKMPEIISYSNGESLLMDKGSKDMIISLLFSNISFSFSYGTGISRIFLYISFS